MLNLSAYFAKLQIFFIKFPIRVFCQFTLPSEFYEQSYAPDHWVFLFEKINFYFS